MASVGESDFMNWPDIQHRLESAVKLCEYKDTKAIIRLLLEVLIKLCKGP